MTTVSSFKKIADPISHVSVVVAVLASAILLYPTKSDGEDQPHTLSQTDQVLFERGAKFLNASEFQNAVDVFSNLIDERPDFFDAYEYRAKAYRGIEREAASQEDKDKAMPQMRATPGNHDEDMSTLRR